MQVDNHKVNQPWAQSYKVIGRGKVGWHAKSESCSSSGGTLATYLKEADEGALVYDAEDAEYSAFVNLTLHGPMVKVSLPAGEIEGFKDKEALARMLPGLEGGFRTIALSNMAGVSSLDYVAIDIYEGLLRGVPGMKIGHVRNGSIVWE